MRLLSCDWLDRRERAEAPLERRPTGVPSFGALFTHFASDWGFTQKKRKAGFGVFDRV
jgi:hypothetical protein